MQKNKKTYHFFSVLRQGAAWSLLLLCVFLSPIVLQFSHLFLHQHEEENCQHESTEIVDACHLKTHHYGIDKQNECHHKTHIDKKIASHCQLCDLFAHPQTVFIEYFVPTIFLSSKAIFDAKQFFFLSFFLQRSEGLFRNKSPPFSIF
jgi:hypothetical protein